MSIFKIAFSNMRKRKGAAITFLIMVIISALMLSVSLSIMLGIGSYYEDKVNELNAPHITALLRNYEDSYGEYAKHYKGENDIDAFNSLYMTEGTFHIGSNESTGGLLLSKESVIHGTFYKPKLIDEQSKRTEDMIIAPLSLKSSGAKAGDKIRLESSGKTYEFTIYGFFEDTVFGGSTTGVASYYIGDTKYDKLATDNNYLAVTQLIVRFQNLNTDIVGSFYKDFEGVAATNEIITAIDYYASESTSLLFVNLLSVLFIIFSVIILIIAFVVVNFSIKNSISEDITNIGSLKSLGYKNKVLRGSQLIQYLMIALAGSLVGSLICLFGFGVVGNIISGTSGLLWTQGINIVPVIITIVAILGLTSLIIYLATRRYKKITPITALRQGESHHSFKRNPMPLTKHKMPLNLHLGFKRFLNSIKSSVTLFIVITLLTFITLFTYVMSYNLNDDRSAMVQMVGLEMADVYAQSMGTISLDEIDENIINMQDVENTTKVGTGISGSIDDKNGTITVMKDYSKLITDTLVRGGYPENVNEIALSATMAKLTGKDLNDMVTLEIRGRKFDYYVSGITQGIADTSSLITESAMLENHDAAYKMNQLYIYLNDNADADAFMNQIKELYGSNVVAVGTDKQLDTILSSIGGPLSMVSILMIVITAIVIAFVLFLIISALINRQKKEFGILKAMGYKNRNLVSQIFISFIPSLLLGVVVGIILGFTVTNPLLSVIFGMMGLVDAYFIIPAAMTIVLGIGLLLLSIIVSYLLSLRMKKITPIKLIVAN